MDLSATLRRKWEEAAIQAGFQRRRAGVCTRAVGSWFIDAKIELNGRNPVSMFGSVNLRHPEIDKLIHAALREKYPQASKEAPVSVRPISGAWIGAIDDESMMHQVDDAVRKWWVEATDFDGCLERLVMNVEGLNRELRDPDYLLTYSKIIQFLLEVYKDSDGAWRSMSDREISSPMNEAIFSWFTAHREQVNISVKAAFAQFSIASDAGSC